MSILGLILFIAGIGGVALVMAENNDTSVQIQAAGQSWHGNTAWLVLGAACLGAVVMLGLTMFSAGAKHGVAVRMERRRLVRERRDLQAENQRLEGDLARAEAAKSSGYEVNYGTPGVTSGPMVEQPASGEWRAGTDPVLSDPHRHWWTGRRQQAV